MEQIAAAPARRARGRWFDLVAMAVIGLVVVGAALIPAATANSGGTTTIRGRVTLDGRPLAFFPVGFWTPADDAADVQGTTDGNGRFTLDVSATAEGYAWAGTAPDDQHAVVSAGGEALVRGVIGGKAPAGVAEPLYQGWPFATGRGLAGGASSMAFRLQRAGRLSGTSPVAASALRAVQVRRVDGSVVQTLRLDSRRRYRSSALVPGDYSVALVPKSPGLTAVTAAAVVPGATTTVQLPAPLTGATVSGTARIAGRSAGGGVPVLLEQGGAVLQATTTASTGEWILTGVAPGDYTIEVGRFDEAPAVSVSALGVPQSQATATPSPSPTPSTAAEAALQPVPRTADSVVPRSFDVAVPASLEPVEVLTDLTAAGRLSGTVALPAGVAAAATVVVEEESTGRIVRSARLAASGAYSVGGLDPGRRYRVWAVTQPSDATLAQMGSTVAVAEEKATRADIVVDRAALTLTGTVADTASGTVAVGDDTLFARTSRVDSSGAFAVQGLVPGAYPVVVSASGRVPSDPVAEVVPEAGAAAITVQPGPRPAVFKGWFISSGAGVPLVTGTAVGTGDAVVRFGPATRDGHVEVGRLAPGQYTYDAASFRGTVPTVDGPWFYQAPTGGFTLSDGASKDVGPIVLHIRAH